MAKSLSLDLRRRVVDVIERGLSCRQAAARFGVSASSAIRWLDRLKKQGGVAAKRQGGDRKSAVSKPKRPSSLARLPRRRTSRSSSFRRS
jgi:transposase